VVLPGAPPAVLEAVVVLLALPPEVIAGGPASIRTACLSVEGTEVAFY
jgi:hypothetical protein